MRSLYQKSYRRQWRRRNSLFSICAVAVAVVATVAQCYSTVYRIRRHRHAYACIARIAGLCAHY